MNAGTEMLTMSSSACTVPKFQRGEITEEKLDWAKCIRVLAVAPAPLSERRPPCRYGRALGLALPGSALMPATSPDLALPMPVRPVSRS